MLLRYFNFLHFIIDLSVSVLQATFYYYSFAFFLIICSTVTRKTKRTKFLVVRFKRTVDEKNYTIGLKL